MYVTLLAGLDWVENINPLFLYSLQLLCVIYKSSYSQPSQSDQIVICDPAGLELALIPGPFQRLWQLVIVALHFPGWCGEESGQRGRE